MIEQKKKNRKNKAVFFDRDGVINYRLVADYVKKVEEFHFIPDFFNFFREVKKCGFLAIIVSNQQGIGKGLMTEDKLDNIHNYMQKQVEAETGYRFDDIFVCPELQSANSPMRKPNPGMLSKAIEKWDIDIRQSWMIGDSINDIIAGNRAGVRTVFLGNIYDGSDIVPEQICKTLDEVIL